MSKGMARLRLLCAVAACLACLAACSPQRISRPDSPSYATRQYALGVSVAKTAQQQIGRRYRYGGESPARGFDCSGLIWWAYRAHGIRIPRASGEQAQAGVRVPSGRLQPGDILVFKTGRFWGGLHTGLYVSDGQFVHSPSSGKRVRMDSLASDYWKPRLKDVRRIIY